MKLFAMTIITALLALPMHASAEVLLEDAWSPPSIPGSKVGVAYFTLHNDTDVPVTIVEAASPAAHTVELHTHQIVDDIMQMRKVDAIDVMAGESVTARPHGLHIMLIDLTEQLIEGETIPLTLTLSTGQQVSAKAAIEKRKSKPMEMHDAGTDHSH